MMNCDKSIRDFNELQKKETKDTWVKCQYTMGLSIALRIFKIQLTPELVLSLFNSFSNKYQK